MSTAAKTIAALLFVTLLAVVLTVPVRDSDPRSEPQRVVASPSPEPSPSPTKREPTEPLRSRRFAQRYPNACLRPAPLPADGGLIAVHRGRSIAVITTSGAMTASISPIPTFGKPPLVSWSPGGRYLAAGSQGLMWTAEGESILAANGEFQHGFVWQSPADPWGWSPVADCGLSIESGAPGVRFGGALWVSSADPDVTFLGQSLIKQGVESFAYSRDGRRLGLVLKEGTVRSIWIADLERSRMKEVRRFERATCCITLAGWSPDDRDLLYWAAPGASVAADGWPLEGVDQTGRVSDYEPMITDPRYLARCGDRLLAVLGGGRGQLPDHARRRLAFIEPGRSPVRLTPASVVTHWPTCAPGGTFLAAVQGRSTRAPGRLVVLDYDGRVVQDFDVIGAELPEWAASGILFAQRLRSGPCPLWFIPAGSGPRSIGSSVACGRFYLPRMYDWSATPPDGLPAG